MAHVCAYTCGHDGARECIYVRAWWRSGVQYVRAWWRSCVHIRAGMMALVYVSIQVRAWLRLCVDVHESMIAPMCGCTWKHDNAYVCCLHRNWMPRCQGCVRQCTKVESRKDSTWPRHTQKTQPHWNTCNTNIKMKRLCFGRIWSLHWFICIQSALLTWMWNHLTF